MKVVVLKNKIFKSDKIRWGEIRRWWLHEKQRLVVEFVLGSSEIKFLWIRRQHEFRQGVFESSTSSIGWAHWGMWWASLGRSGLRPGLGEMRLSVFGFRAHTSLRYVWATKPVRPNDYFQEREETYLQKNSYWYLQNWVACHLLGYVKREIDHRIRVRVRSVLALAPWVPSPFLSPR